MHHLGLEGHKGVHPKEQYSLLPGFHCQHTDMALLRRLQIQVRLVPRVNKEVRGNGLGLTNHILQKALEIRREQQVDLTE